MANYIAGVDIGGTSVKFGVFEDGKNLIYKASKPSVIGDPDGMVELIAGMVEETPYRIDKMGVGTPGTVMLPQNLVSAGNLHWHNAPLCAMLMCERPPSIRGLPIGDLISLSSGPNPSTL